jgi:Uma2 family endonuclease
MTTIHHPVPRQPAIAWDVARLYPPQGQWDESDYLALTENMNRLVELSDGYLEVLPMPKTSHQRIVQYLSTLLAAFVTARSLGTVLFAPLRIKLGKGRFREPDVVFMAAAHAARIGEDYWDGADLVIEVLSTHAKDRKRDLVTKRREYAQAGIAEYWIVDPQEKRITVLKRRGKTYVVHCEAQSEGTITSSLLKGLEVSAGKVFASAHSRPNP